LSRLRPTKLLCASVLLRSSASPPATRTATKPAASGTPGGNLGMGKCPPADRLDPRRSQIGRRLRGRKAPPPARSMGTNQGDQRSPTHSPNSRSLANLEVQACRATQCYWLGYWPGYWPDSRFIFEGRNPNRRQASRSNGPEAGSDFQYDSYRRDGVYMRRTASGPRRVPAVLSSRLQIPACAERAKRRQNSRGGK
jgi:hypothetical protein